MQLQAVLEPAHRSALLHQRALHAPLYRGRRCARRRRPPRAVMKI
jgi:hypothetical protein